MDPKSAVGGPNQISRTGAKLSSTQWALWAAYGHFIRLVLRAHPARLIATSIIAVCPRFTDNQNFIKRASHLGRVLSFPIKQFPFYIVPWPTYNPTVKLAKVMLAPSPPNSLVPTRPASSAPSLINLIFPAA